MSAQLQSVVESVAETYFNYLLDLAQFGQAFSINLGFKVGMRFKLSEGVLTPIDYNFFGLTASAPYLTSALTCENLYQDLLEEVMAHPGRLIMVACEYDLVTLLVVEDKLYYGYDNKLSGLLDFHSSENTYDMEEQLKVMLKQSKIVKLDYYDTVTTVPITEETLESWKVGK